eukprot:3611026-Lingulodinium_polyedra.AAC.1
MMNIGFELHANIVDVGSSVGTAALLARLVVAVVAAVLLRELVGWPPLPKLARLWCAGAPRRCAALCRGLHRSRGSGLATTRPPFAAKRANAHARVARPLTTGAVRYRMLAGPAPAAPERR